MKTLIFTLLYFLSAFGSCRVSNHENARQDLLLSILKTAKECPVKVQELKGELINDGIEAKPAMVANRGAHNPKYGSFSIFESVAGYSLALKKVIKPEHLFFGHFTTSKGGYVELDQESANGKLIIEAMAYDFIKKVYNFYELVGTASGPQWFYRGDSFDAYADNKELKLKSNPAFGKRMRCSACHNSGGPIMKELKFPHNDWWTKRRGLTFGDNHLSQEIKTYMSELIDASEFSKSVVRGMKLLKNNDHLSLKEKLRPLFCATEINLESDINPLSSPATELEITSAVFINPLLARPRPLRMNKALYLKGLGKLGSKFPETNFLDAQHGFLAPVKAHTNHLQVLSLLKDGVVDKEFVFDVLSIDFKKPLFSKERCGLLKLVKDGAAWKEEFKESLMKSETASAKELFEKMQVQDAHIHKKAAQEYLKTKAQSWATEMGVVKELKKLNRLRLSVSEDEISSNPKGQILEPGFRVIFPEFFISPNLDLM